MDVDVVSIGTGETAVALSHSDATAFSCFLEPPGAVTATGFFNVTVDVHREKRGTAYRQWSRSVDVAGGSLFDVELGWEIYPIAPRSGNK